MILKITHENPLWGWGARAQKKEIRKEFKDIYGTTKERCFQEACFHSFNDRTTLFSGQN